MADAAVARSVQGTGRVAVTVINANSSPILCPFFGKCEGILVFDGAGGGQSFRPNEHRTPEQLCSLIIEVGPETLICGYVGEPERNRLRAAGVDVRLGSCNCAIDELMACLCDLPEA